MRARRGAGLVTATVLLSGSLFAGMATNAAPAQRTTVAGTLPGGTSIDVTITTPPDGARFSPGPVTVAGTASVGTGEPVPDTALVYVLDLSSSTGQLGCGGDENGDERTGTVLDCEIASARALNREAIALGTIGDVGAAAFGAEARTADVGPADGKQLLTRPGTDDNGTDGPDIEEVLTSAWAGEIREFGREPVGSSATNFEQGIIEATIVARASQNRRKIVVFLSDGMATAGGSIRPPLADVPAEVDFFTFAVGPGSACDNQGIGQQGSLEDIALATGGTCTQVDDPGDLPAVLPGVIAAELVSLTLRVDGGPATPITDVTPPLPRDGPATVDYVTRTPDLAAGTHRLCVTANGRDSGGTGSVTACHTITVNTDSGPGGPGIAVAIATPPDLAVLGPGPVAVTGTASIGQGRELSDAAVVYVLDVSGSSDAVVDGGCGGDQNGDGRADRILDCEIAAARALNDRAVLGATLTDVGAVVFGRVAATADVGPAAAEQFITGPAADRDGRGGRDIDQVRASAFSSAGDDGGVNLFTSKYVGAETNFADAITKATTVAQASGKARKIVAFLSDGIATAGGDLDGPLAEVPAGVDFFTFAVGSGSSCDNPGANDEGSLADIADVTGGTCTEIQDAASLPTTLPGLITSMLTSLTMRVDDRPEVAVTDVTPALPATGPVEVRYAATVAELTAGAHTVCVTAAGRESGRPVTATDCHAVTVRLPTLTVRPPLGTPGLVTQAVGVDFPPGTRVRLAWTVGVSETPGEVTVGPDGRFAAQVLVFHRDLLGRRELTATPLTGPAYAPPRSPFLVVARSLQPPSFQTRR